MSTVDEPVRQQVEEAQRLLDGLALPGTPGHAALAALAAARRSGRELPTVALLAVLDELTTQAELGRRAGERARHTGHWVAATAHEWQHYLRWLVATVDDVAPTVAATADPAAVPTVHPTTDPTGIPQRTGVVAAWERAADACARARQVWAAVAADLPPASEPAASVSTPPAAPSTHTPPAVRDELDSVVVDGRVYVSAEELAASLRGRAAAFVEAAHGADAAGDELGVLVSEVVADELSARADALDLAGIALASEPGAPTGP